jgi:hypothetical protein
VFIFHLSRVARIVTPDGPAASRAAGCAGSGSLCASDSQNAPHRRLRAECLPSRSAPVPVIFGNKGRSRSGGLPRGSEQVPGVFSGTCSVTKRGLPSRRAQVLFCSWNLRDFEAGACPAGVNKFPVSFRELVRLRSGACPRGERRFYFVFGTCAISQRGPALA